MNLRPSREIELINDTKSKDKRSLNDFPDEILTHIVSFLPMKLAIQTSVLSKRWEPMWKSLPSLDFVENINRNPIRSEDQKRKRENFLNFMDNVVNLPNVSRLENFSLQCKVGNDISRIKTWISTAVNRNAKEFDIKFVSEYVEDGHLFPDLLFSSEAIEILKIKLSFDHYTLQFPPQIYLPCLKILILKHIFFDDPHHPTNSLFASPTLEELVIDNCFWCVNSYELSISAPKLRSLKISETYDFLTSEADLYNSSAPILESFHYTYTGVFTKKYRFSCSSCNLKATIINKDYEYEGVIPVENFVENEILRSLHFVTYLKLSSLQVLSRVKIPIFRNLITMEVFEDPINLGCDELPMILYNCPQLENLRFPMGIKAAHDSYMNSNYFTCLPSTLKKITFGSFRGNKKELIAIRILLGMSSTTLQTIEIAFAKDVSNGKEIETVLSAYQKRSKSCKLDFIMID